MNAVFCVGTCEILQEKRFGSCVRVETAWVSETSLDVLLLVNQQEGC